MKPLSHPHIEDVTVEGILNAFSNPVRIQIYAQLVAADCPQCCSAYLRIKGDKLPKSTLSQHFAVLREAGLIRSERKGTELHSTTRCDELEERFGPMIDAILDSYLAQSTARKKKKR
ncbi:MAG: helix-turn-helix domain-containing protein [Rhizomicrobium sp.]|jgi:DNA-binding transcriptional ArsR family regulator